LSGADWLTDGAQGGSEVVGQGGTLFWQDAADSEGWSGQVTTNSSCLLSPQYETNWQGNIMRINIK